jgi:hypothetical protein
MSSDAATAGYVSNYATHLNNVKVNWTGGSMTGDLSMGGHKLTGLPIAVAPSDAVSKEYIDEHAPRRPYNLGRYIVQPFGDEKIYYSVRTKNEY